MWDKYTRANAALSSGADLVLEMPITGVLQSAEGFASAGVEILSKLGCVDHLCFGVEKGDSETYMTLANKIDSEVFNQKLRLGLDAGLPYAAARQQALEDETGLLETPNNILGLEYCRAIIRSSSRLKPLTIIRNSSYHDQQPHSTEPSATAIRSLFPDNEWQRYVPQEVAAVLKDAPWYDLQFGERAILARLRGLDDTQWENCAHGSEGLWRKAMKAARTQPNLEAIITATKSKRYPRARIQRLLLCAYLGITNLDLQYPIPYVRVLAASNAGKAIIRQAKAYDVLPIINPGQLPMDRGYYDLECRTTRLYTLFAAPEFETSALAEENGRIYLK